MLKLIFVLLISFIKASIACDCVVLNLDMNFQTAHEVFTGLVTEVNSKTKDATFKIDKVYKGEASTPFIVKIGSSMCSFQFEKNKSYLVFTSIQGPTLTSTRSRTSVIEKAREDLALLETAEPQIKEAFNSISHRLIRANVKEERHVIKDRVSFEKLWNRFDNNIPAILPDFTKHDVLVYFLGTFGSSGSFAKITEITKQEIKILQCRPEPNSLRPQVVKSPYLIKVIPKFSTSPEWKITKGVTGKNDCK